MGGDRRSRLLEHRAAVLELVAKQPDLTLQEIHGALGGARYRDRADECVAVSQGAADYAQKKSLHATEQSLPRRRPGIAPT
jgi:hypothetical protein